MGLTRSYLVSLLLYASIVNEIRLPVVTCQDEEVTQCIPKRAFLALLRLPEVSSNLAAYSRTAKVIQDANKRNDMAQLRALTEENDDTEICIRGEVYLELFKDPAMRGHLSVIGRTQKLPDLPRRLLDDSEEIDSLAESHKRSLATLAKNDDLPISIQDRLEENHDDEEKRTGYLSEQSERSAPEFSGDYMLPSERLDLEALMQNFPSEKRNVGSLARDFALPPGRRNIASLVRDYELQNKENVGNRMLPVTGKRNVASLARTFTLPQAGKRNVASIARDYALPYGKRYVGALARTGDFPSRGHNKRSIASMSKNSAWPVSLKRGISIPASVILRTLSRHGRSLSDELNTRNEPLDLQVLNNLEGTREENHKDDVFVDDKLGGSEEKSGSNERINFSDRRPRRQIDLSDEYPLPVIQNIDGLDYEEMMEALARRYQNAEKRFMETGSTPEMQSTVDQVGSAGTFQASKRHIAALARGGSLPRLRSARFSRSPRDFIGRENPTDGSSSNYPPNSSARSLRRNFNHRPRYIQALHEDCRHGFRRFFTLPAANNFLRQKVPNSI
ncbi:neuropeptide-like precursor 1 isoform X2 [Andrena cerasifolii]|uniref:neuropeptide-like precursor 1 isoform X2 n=1 Tax=Andrena cerasifolii TaxID=2819439 RepID=UPI00403775A7